MQTIHYEKRQKVFVFQNDTFLLQPPDYFINQNGLCLKNREHSFNLDIENWTQVSQISPNSQYLKNMKGEFTCIWYPVGLDMYRYHA
jgi:hypothetical protein